VQSSNETSNTTIFVYALVLGMAGMLRLALGPSVNTGRRHGHKISWLCTGKENVGHQ